ncbi:MAG: glutamine--fructose-6-phosphate transaminase (isomerizing), partial [Bacilli bacterium]|nr:glutamine--fructose-6-phosphate transaminase (isomerizing) [Bacilli bacterium]
YKFKTDTDTEVAAVLLYDLYKKTGNILKAIKLFKEKVIGSYAIGLICTNEPDTLYAIKKNSPLIIGYGEDENYIASDIIALSQYTTKYIVLSDGDYAKLDSNHVYVYDNNGKSVEREIKTYISDGEIISKNGYEHYMLKEIYEEPEVIKKTSIIKKIPDISNYKHIIIVACGSAMHAGLIGKHLLEEYGGIPTDVEMASEFRYKRHFLDKDTLVIAISQSGETADTLEAVKIVKEYKVKTIGIINVKESSIAREVDTVIYTEAGREIAVATTKAYVSQVLVLAMLASKLIKDKDIYEKFNDELKKLPILIEKTWELDNEYKNISETIYQERDIFFIGRCVDYALCMEGSLKLKEISYLHSEAYPAGELKHGTISLIENGTPVIGIVTDENIASKTISNLKEVKARGAYVVYITTKSLYLEGDFYDKVIILPDIIPLLEPIITVVPLQFIAYYTAKLNKCDIDNPKNLAKSVTVE